MVKILGKFYEVEKEDVIGRINCIIRDEMLKVNSAAELTDLKKRSDYLCTLTYSPFCKKEFKNIETLRKIAIEENRITVKTANYISNYKNFNKKYDPWKKEIDIEEELKKIPSQVIEEFKNSLFSLKNSVEVLESLRKFFCDIRKNIIRCKNLECLNEQVEKSRNVISSLTYTELESPEESTEEFTDKSKKLFQLMDEGTEKTIEIAYIVCKVNKMKDCFK